MNLSVGIVGLPNVGKSTLFNALMEKQQAFAANFPFATVEPNVGIVPVKDSRLDQLAQVVNTDKIIPATVKFVDIAGLVKGASQGEGLGNQFLAHIREVSLIAHVIRHFHDNNVVQTGSGHWLDDFITIETELQLADLSTLEKQKPPKGKVSPADQERWQLINHLKQWLSQGKSLRHSPFASEAKLKLKDLGLLTLKPVILVINLDENDLYRLSQIEEEIKNQLSQPLPTIGLAAKLEAELIEFSPQEKQAYLAELGIKTTSLDRLIQLAYHHLNLQSFLTAGSKEVRAWTIQTGTTAQQAAGVIHSDFEKGFIAAKICDFSDFIRYQGWKGAAEAGKVRQEGRDYIMQTNDVVEFMVTK